MLIGPLECVIYHCLISYAFKWEVKLILKMLDLFIQCLFNILCTHLDKFETNLMNIEHPSTQKHFQNNGSNAFITFFFSLTDLEMY
jgi:hypothetical protein